MTTIDAAYWIDHLGLQPHPEGGYYRETYRATATVDIGGSVRSASTAIYFLLERGQFSALHRIKSDEVWHFYAGGELSIYELHPNGPISVKSLGNQPERGSQLQQVVKAGTWFGAELADGVDYALVGCTVAPGFDFADFEMGDRDELSAEFPEHVDVISWLTR